jgi:hypothetical protein
MMMEASMTSETSVNFYQTTRPYNPEDIHQLNIVGFVVLTAASMKMAVFWVAATCSLIDFSDVSEVFAASNIRAP